MKNLLLVQRKINAYTLVEFLIYISLFSFIFILFLGALNRQWLEILRVGRKQKAELEIALACDILRRDLLCASSVRRDWNDADFIIKRQYIDSKNEIVGEWIHWYVNDKSLMRAVGKYDPVKKTWQGRDTSLVCSCVYQVKLNLDIDLKNNVVVGAIIMLNSKRQFYVELRNRILK